MAHPLNEDSARHQFADEVRRYYDANTERFERLGQGAAFVHRGVWAPGVNTPDQAFTYVERFILEHLQQFSMPTVVDLGCGLGASLIYLARHRPMTGEGITISPIQAMRAEELSVAAGLAGRVRCRVGNFLALPGDLQNIDLAFSIEAFVHSPDAARYFREAARILRPGGRLIICDDFLTAETSTHSSRRTERWIAEFRRGWHVGSLLSVEQARLMGREAGLQLVCDRDLTAYLRLDAARDRLLRLAADVAQTLPFVARSKYWNSMVGGAALQRGLRAGVLAYRIIGFERVQL
jgi:cyclopropane fatty-acyl-phospholipid synthase-like methyltransferase